MTKTELTDSENGLTVLAAVRGRGIGQMPEDGPKVQTSSYKVSKAQDVMQSVVTTVSHTVFYR